MSLLSKVSEYFFGTETLKSLKYREGFYREFITDDNHLNILLKSINGTRNYHILLGKFVPALVDAYFIGHSLSSNEPPYGLIAGEGFRAFFSYILTPKKMFNRISNILISRDKDPSISKRVKSLVDRLNN